MRSWNLLSSTVYGVQCTVQSVYLEHLLNCAVYGAQYTVHTVVRTAQCRIGTLTEPHSVQCTAQSAGLEHLLNCTVDTSAVHPILIASSHLFFFPSPPPPPLYKKKQCQYALLTFYILATKPNQRKISMYIIDTSKTKPNQT